MSTGPKTTLCTVRMSATETERASKVADHYGITVSSAIRMLLKREATGLGIEPLTTKTTERKAR